MSDEKINKQLLNDLDFELEIEQRLVNVFNENQASGFNKKLVEAGPINWGTSLTPNLDKLKAEHKTKNKLTEDDVFEVRKLLAADVPQKEIAERFKVKVSTISSIKIGKTWRSLDDEGLNSKIDFTTPASFDGSTTSAIHLDEFGQWETPSDSKVQANLFGEEEPIADPGRFLCLTGQDIITIRTLTGKKKENAVAALNQLTEEMLRTAPIDSFYIRGNVASSKNGKNPVTVRNINKKTGKPQEFTTLVPNDLVKSYIRDTKGQWLQNKVEFLNQTRHLPLPISVEFTFIRESLRAYDFINAAQILMDLMGGKHGYGWIEDDETCRIVPVFNPITYYHSKMAGVLIRVIS